MKIEECAAKKQARIDSGKDVIVGVNKFKLANEEDLNVLTIDNTKVREGQIRKLQQLRATRNSNECKRALDALTECAKTGQGNLLDLSVRAARARATVGEITQALEVVFKRHVAKDNLVSGAYKSEYSDESELKKIADRVNHFEKKDGRRPRILVAKLGQDGHDRGAKIIASSFSDLGFDVDIGPLFATPDEVANQAIDSDCHVVGVSTLGAGHKTLIPQLIEKLKALNRPYINTFF